MTNQEVDDRIMAYLLGICRCFGTTDGTCEHRHLVRAAKQKVNKRYTQMLKAGAFNEKP